jgi:hypothetical protein
MNQSMLTGTCAVLFLVVATTSALSQSEQIRKRTVKKDAETRIVTHANSFKPYPGQTSCVQGGPVTIQVTKPPQNGEVFLKPAIDKNPNCSNEINGTGIFYKPKPGFTGTDTFSYNRTDEGIREVNKAGGPQGARTVSIEVRP